MKNLVNIKKIAFVSTREFLDIISNSEITSFGGWRNTVKFALALAFSKHKLDVRLDKNSLGYSFIGLHGDVDMQSQEPNQLVKRFVMAGLLAMETDDAEYVFQFTEAWTLYKVRVKTSRTQSKKASENRGKNDTTLTIKELAKENGSAKALWNRFLGEINLLNETDNGALFLDENDKEKTMTFKNFSNILSSSRNNPD